MLARDTLYLIELKHYRGTLRGNDHVWLRNGQRAEDSPLILGRRKAQYFASLSKESPRQRADHLPKGVIPYVQELVFLHHPDFLYDLPPNSAINLYGLDGATSATNLPGICERLLAPARNDPVSEHNSQLIAGLMNAIGLAPLRQREVGSWIIDEHPTPTAMAGKIGRLFTISTPNVTPASASTPSVRARLLPTTMPANRPSHMSSGLLHDQVTVSVARPDWPVWS